MPSKSAGGTHTPEPWRYSGPTEEFGIVWAGKVPLADFSMNDLSCDEQRANALRTVALSAEVAALTKAMEEIAECLSEDNPDPLGGTDEAREIARKALAGEGAK